MTALAQQQQALLDTLFAWPRDNAMINVANYVDRTLARHLILDPNGESSSAPNNGPRNTLQTGPNSDLNSGLSTYQAHGHMLAERTLRAAYTVLAQLLGADSFASLSRALWHAHPPVCGDLAQWGGDMAGFVNASDQLTDEPYLSDVARVEWALHTCAGAADRAAAPVTFLRMTDHDPATLRLVLAPGSAVLHSAWPVVSIVMAHLYARDRVAGGGDGDGDGGGHGLTEPASSLSAASNKLHAGVAETAVIWRAGYQPQVRESVPGETQLLTALLAGRSLDDAVQSANLLDFNTWLPMAVQSGLLLAVEIIQPRAAVECTPKAMKH